MTFDVQRRGYRVTHAESHGVLHDELAVPDDPAPELVQGPEPADIDALPG